VVQYSGFPAGASLFVPTVVAGSDATQHRGRDLGVSASGESIRQCQFIVAAFVSSDHGRQWCGWDSSLFARSSRLGHGDFDSMSE